ncbi:MAG: helix-turn-helix transcriptional regulator [Acidobacteria bacterium]|nr:helix-turn-helix transcriptional regulator [Acidobacteriota bacterium]
MKHTRSTENSSRQDLFSGLIRLHVLYHASKEPIFGLGMIEELARHGYKISAGTLYPLLHRMQRNGLLRASKEKHGRTSRKLYRTTHTGNHALRVAKRRVKELFGELFEMD